MSQRRRVGVVRADSMGDVLLGGPAIRAIAARAAVIHFASPRGAEAAALLPGVSRVVTLRLPWIERDCHDHDDSAIARVVAALQEAALDELIIFTSDHQSALPTALCGRMAGIARIAAISHDFPGSLLDVRHRATSAEHEVERALRLAEAAGYPLPMDDDGALRVRGAVAGLPRRGVVVHPGSSAPARTLPPERFTRVVELLLERGHAVTVTVGPDDAHLAGVMAGWRARDLRLVVGAPLAELVALYSGAAVAITGNTGPAHLAAAVGCPVVAVFPPTVPLHEWRPWGRSIVLGDQTVSCAGCRAIRCPLPQQHCLDEVTPDAVIDAVEHLATAATESAVA